MKKGEGLRDKINDVYEMLSNLSNYEREKIRAVDGKRFLELNAALI